MRVTNRNPLRQQPPGCGRWKSQTARRSAPSSLWRLPPPQEFLEKGRNSSRKEGALGCFRWWPPADDVAPGTAAGGRLGPRATAAVAGPLPPTLLRACGWRWLSSRSCAACNRVRPRRAAAMLTSRQEPPLRRGCFACCELTGSEQPRIGSGDVPTTFAAARCRDRHRDDRMHWPPGANAPRPPSRGEVTPESHAITRTIIAGHQGGKDPLPKPAVRAVKDIHPYSKRGPIEGIRE
jgi:hypothetical protein